MSKDHDPHPGQYPPPPPQWESRGPYPLPPQQGPSYSGPPTSQPYYQQTPSGPGEMVTLPPPQSQQQQDLYRHPPYDMYPGHPQHMPYPPNTHDPHGNPQQHPQMNFSQPAPRQRTAIACRYCRRRKIRCHGFDSSPDGRCTNCIRFHQECIFTPVSSQAHAFVPAHTAYPHLRNTGRMPQHPYPPQGQPLIYGAHGQPLGPMPHDPNYPPPPPGYGPSPYPAAMYEGGPPQPPHPQDQVSRKRPRLDEPSIPVVSTPTQGSSSHPYPEQQRLSATTGGRRGSAGGTFEYPDPPQLAPVSPASSSTSYQSQPYPPQKTQQPYYPPQVPVRRASPQSAYSYEARASGSPHDGSISSASGYAPYPGGLHPPQVLPPTRESGRTPPPGQGQDGANSGNGSRAGMSVRDMLSPGEGQGGRTSADSDMLKALNKRVM
ncbi:hypothetical protein MMC13_004136 [Lambiella insularis]|nr:hypothetical protein [Lambiella insularis]